jgi:hypothetical protein
MNILRARKDRTVLVGFENNDGKTLEEVSVRIGVETDR